MSLYDSRFSTPAAVLLGALVLPSCSHHHQTRTEGYSCRIPLPDNEVKERITRNQLNFIRQLVHDPSIKWDRMRYFSESCDSVSFSIESSFRGDPVRVEIWEMDTTVWESGKHHCELSWGVLLTSRTDGNEWVLSWGDHLTILPPEGTHVASHDRTGDEIGEYESLLCKLRKTPDRWRTSREDVWLKSLY